MTLAGVIGTCTIDFLDSEECKLSGWTFETELETIKRRRNTFTNNIKVQALALSKELRNNWPRIKPYIANKEDYPLYHIPTVLAALQSWFESWSRNSEFRNHIMKVQQVLDKINSRHKPQLQIYQFQPGHYTPSRARNTIRISDLLTHSAPELPPYPIQLRENTMLQVSSASPQVNNGLELLLLAFRGQGSSKVREMYAKGLEKSIVAFQAQFAPSNTAEVAGLRERLKALQDQSKNYMSAIYSAIITHLGPEHQTRGSLHLKGSLMASKAGLWPRISPVILLQQLATNRAIQLSPDWKAAMVTYGIAITIFQRLQRLLSLAPESMELVSADFLKELENTGHTNWVPLEQPDWLLIEIEQNFLIRPVQADMAATMITPPNNHNSIMQLCMGEGKTSVIVPIVAASLADKSKLVRVVVLKPLSGQMFQTLVQKLSGLVNRRIFFLPFSRGIAMGLKEIEIVKRLYHECIQSCGVLLIQPEHILSFKLLGLEWLYKSKNMIGRSNDSGSKQDSTVKNSNGWGNHGEVASWLQGTQRWLELNSRDILDESDEILNIKHELIYTIGDSMPVENHPNRWIIIQEIFDLIHAHFKVVRLINRTSSLCNTTKGVSGRFGF